MFNSKTREIILVNNVFQTKYKLIEKMRAKEILYHVERIISK